ncbi:hypothetical protein [Bacteroides acidifaciens]|nr:hypothetical protein [Bacteroides acidifaciens]
MAQVGSDLLRSGVFIRALTVISVFPVITELSILPVCKDRTWANW